MMNWRIPSEFEKHHRTWIAWPWDANIWNRIPNTSLESVQETIVNLAILISKYESVALLIPKSFDQSIYSRYLIRAASQFRIEFIDADYNDIWVRDTLPTFALNGTDKLVAVDWRFNGWGRRSRAFGKDAVLARRVAELTGARLVRSDAVAEGGAFAFDGNGLLVATKSVMFDRNRNNEKDLAILEQALYDASRCTSICWLPGDRSEPVTTGHADGILAFGPRRTVFFHWVADRTSPEFDICDYNLRVFEDWARAQKRQYDIVRLIAPNHKFGDSLCASYVNFAVVNGGIILPTLSDSFSAENEAARSQIEVALRGEYKVEMLDILSLAAAGGGVHCATCNEPATPNARTLRSPLIGVKAFKEI